MERDIDREQRGERFADLADDVLPGWRTSSVPTGPVWDPDLAARFRAGVDAIYPELQGANRKRDSADYLTPHPRILSRPPLELNRIVIGEYAVSVRTGRITQDMTVASTSGADPLYYSGGPTQDGNGLRRHAHDFADRFARDGSYGGREVRRGHYHFDDHEVADASPARIPDEHIRGPVEAAREFLARISEIDPDRDR